MLHQQAPISESYTSTLSTFQPIHIPTYPCQGQPVVPPVIPGDALVASALPKAPHFLSTNTFAPATLQPPRRVPQPVVIHPSGPGLPGSGMRAVPVSPCLPGTLPAGMRMTGGSSYWHAMLTNEQ